MSRRPKPDTQDHKGSKQANETLLWTEHSKKEFERRDYEVRCQNEGAGHRVKIKLGTNKVIDIVAARYRVPPHEGVK